RPSTSAGRPCGTWICPEPGGPILSAGRGRSQAKDLQGEARCAQGDARDRGAGALHVLPVPPPGAPTPRLLQLRPLPRARGRAASRTRAVAGRNVPEATMSEVTIAVDAMGGD